MGSFLGYTMIGMLLILFSILPLKKIYIKTKNKKVLSANKILRKIHPFLGMSVILIAFIHAYLQLGSIRFHNGFFIVIIIVCMAIVRVMGQKIPYMKKRWLNIHKLLILPLILSVINHVFL